MQQPAIPNIGWDTFKTRHHSDDVSAFERDVVDAFADGTVNFELRVPELR
jgi:hypothetical protein